MARLCVAVAAGDSWFSWPTLRLVSHDLWHNSTQPDSVATHLRLQLVGGGLFWGALLATVLWCAIRRVGRGHAGQVANTLAPLLAPLSAIVAGVVLLWYADDSPHTYVPARTATALTLLALFAVLALLPGQTEQRPRDPDAVLAVFGVFGWLALRDGLATEQDDPDFDTAMQVGFYLAWAGTCLLCALVALLGHARRGLGYTHGGHGSESLSKHWGVVGLFPGSSLTFAHAPMRSRITWETQPGQPLPVVLRARKELPWLSYPVAVITCGVICRVVREFTVVVYGLPADLRNVFDDSVDAVTLMDVLDGHATPGPWTAQRCATTRSPCLCGQQLILEAWTLTVTCVPAETTSRAQE